MRPATHAAGLRILAAILEQRQARRAREIAAEWTNEARWQWAGFDGPHDGARIERRHARANSR